ncbi:importin subunit beta-1 isoform X2 [Lepeophtheirus salmonis]|nr:importin subunit beta-1-like isoform X2 [Lepeophtheirus salmonis]
MTPTAQLLQVLEKTISPDQSELQAAQQFLEHAAQTSLTEFLKSLSDILAGGGNSSVARRQAGIQLKNQIKTIGFASRDRLAPRDRLTERWFTEIPLEVREYVKRNVVGALGMEGYRPSAAAQCVQHLAEIELPKNLWPDLIGILVENVTNQNSTEMLRESALEALGYICQENDSQWLESKSNQILTAIVHGMKKDEPSSHVRLAATNALLNSLEFTRANFDKEAERHFIMQVVCEATQATDLRVKVAALEVLVKIMSHYYQYMEAYMGPALFAITLEAMKSDCDEVALQGIEFWSNVCDEEVDLQIEAADAQEIGRPPEHVSRYYAKGALQFIVPILMETLVKQEDYDDEDDWKPCKAAGVCLMLLASCCEDDIVIHVLSFVKDNIKHVDWRRRDAALMAFGSILEGPDASKLKPIVDQAMPMLMELMKDSVVIVKDTAAWAIGRVCELIPQSATNPTYLQPLLEALVSGLSAEPRVSANVCWAFTSLSEAAYEAAQGSLENPSDTPETYCLSPYFDHIIQKLLETTDRADAGTGNLRSAAYEALMEMVKNSPKDCYLSVQNTILIILERLQQVLQLESRIQSPTDRLQYYDLQSLLCATMQSVLRKMESPHASQIADPIMTSLLHMFQSSVANKTGGVQEDALMAVSTLVGVIGEGFHKYMESFKPYLLIGLKNVAEYQVCHDAVGLVGDICRALGSNVTPYCDEIMTILLENLSNNRVNRIVKPQIFCVFGDIALALGPDFKKYLDIVFRTLVEASQVRVDKVDIDMMEYLNELREGCLDACTGIIQGLKGNGPTNSPDLALIHPHVQFMVQFITTIGQDSEHSDGTICSSAGLIGDICAAFGPTVYPMLDTKVIEDILIEGRRSRVNKTKTISFWATKEMKRLKNDVSTS